MKNKNIRYLIIFILILLLVRSKLSFYNLSRHQIPFSSVESKQKDTSPKDLSDGNIQNIIDGSLQSGYNCNVKQKECDNTVYFKSPTKIDQIEIYFSYNLAREVIVEYQTSLEVPWKPLESIKDNNFSLVTISNVSGRDEKVNSLKFSFSKPSTGKGQIGIGEIRAFYQQKNSNLIELFQKLIIVKREPLSYVYYSLLFIALTILVGLSITFQRSSTISPIDLSLILLKGISIISLLGLITLFLKTNFILIIVLIILISISLTKLLKNKLSITHDSKLIIILMIIYLVNLLIFFNFNGYNDIKQIEEYDKTYDNSTYFPTQYGAYQTDFQLPFAVTKIWNYDLSLTNPSAEKIMTGYKPSDRTPLLSLYSLPFLSIFGDRHFIFEVISIIISPAFLLGYWILISTIFNKKIATITSILLSFNQWIFFASHFGQVRLVVIFFLSLFLYYSYQLIKTKNSDLIFMASLTAALSFLSHPFSLVYIAPIAIFQYFYFVKKKFDKPLLFCLKIYSLTLVAFVLWQLWSKTEPGNSLLVSSMVSSSWNNTNMTMQMTRPIQIDNLRSIFTSKVENLLGVFLSNPKHGVQRSFGILRTTLPPSLGLFIIPLIIFSIIKFPSKMKMQILLFSLSVILFTTMGFLSFYAILGLNWYHLGLIPLLVGIGASLLPKTPRLFQKTIIILSMIEFYYITYVYYPFEAGNNVYSVIIKNKSAIIYIIIALAIQLLIVFKILPKNKISDINSGSIH